MTHLLWRCKTKTFNDSLRNVRVMHRTTEAIRHINTSGHSCDLYRVICEENCEINYFLQLNWRKKKQKILMYSSAIIDRNLQTKYFLSIPWVSAPKASLTQNGEKERKISHVVRKSIDLISFLSKQQSNMRHYK